MVNKMSARVEAINVVLMKSSRSGKLAKTWLESPADMARGMDRPRKQVAAACAGSSAPARLKERLESRGRRRAGTGAARRAPLRLRTAVHDATSRRTGCPERSTRGPRALSNSSDVSSAAIASSASVKMSHDVELTSRRRREANWRWSAGPITRRLCCRLLNQGCGKIEEEAPDAPRREQAGHVDRHVGEHAAEVVDPRLHEAGARHLDQVDGNFDSHEQRLAIGDRAVDEEVGLGGPQLDLDRPAAVRPRCAGRPRSPSRSDFSGLTC